MEGRVAARPATRPEQPSMTSQDRTIDWGAEAGRPEEAAEPSAGSAAELVRVLDRYLADLQAGRAPDRDRLLADHPELADRLESCLAGIDFIHRAADAKDSLGGTPARLGEFVILREIGRGGMGVVYEAEQTTLRRRVAL